MNRNFTIAYVSDNSKNSSKVFSSFDKFNLSSLDENKLFKTKKISIEINELDFLTGASPHVVIFDCIYEEKIPKVLIQRIKEIIPLCHFIYFCEKFDKQIFENILKKGIEYCISLDFFTDELFHLTLINLFKKVLSILKINKTIIWENDISMNLIERKVWKSGKEIILTKNEFDILKFFLNNPNKWFSKDELFRKIWGYVDDDVTGLVTQYIFKIKKKIGKENIIRSQSDGYCFRKIEAK